MKCGRRPRFFPQGSVESGEEKTIGTMAVASLNVAVLVLQWKMQFSVFYLLTCLTLFCSRKMLSVLAETHASREDSRVPEGSVEEAQFQLMQAAGHPRAVGQTPCVLWQGVRSDLEPSYRPVLETVSCPRPPLSRVPGEACALSLPAGFSPGPDADFAILAVTQGSPNPLPARALRV